MADEADYSGDRAETEEKVLRDAYAAAAAAIPKGNPGVCYSCEEFSPRLVHGACRDKFGLM